MPPEKKVLWLWKSYWPLPGQDENFFIITSSSLSVKCVAWKSGFRLNVIAEYPLCDPVWRWERYAFLVCSCLKCTCTGRWVRGPWRWRFSRLLHHVLDPRQGLLYWHWGVWAASLLGELQDGHVAEWTHLPHLQPLNEAPVRKQSKKGILKYRGL